ncbi:MAG: hypothetical protein ABJ327_17415, partial [Litoreibacter sp.]
MILTLLIISSAAGFAAAYASKADRIGWVLGASGVVWVAGVLFINKGTKETFITEQTVSGSVSGTVNLGILLILMGLALSTALAIGRLMRGRATPMISGLT